VVSPQVIFSFIYPYFFLFYAGGLLFRKFSNGVLLVGWNRRFDLLLFSFLRSSASRFFAYSASC
jgi:hypothetical protein